MSLATLYNRIRTPSDMEEWVFSNKSDHDDIAAAILAKKNIQVTKFPIWPVSQVNLLVFMWGHQAMHIQEASILNTDLQDFGALDPTKLETLNELLFDHADQHRRERAALGI